MIGMSQILRIDRVLIIGLALIGFTLQPVLGSAQVATNITSSGLGTVVTANGNSRDITGGTRRDANLFHSFGLFNVGTGDIANFFNDTGAATNNILGRVNGGQTSNIFGTIRTTNFGSANLYLINPAGWIFGPTASLDLGGSFHVSTADYIRLNDEVRFNASGLNDGLLTSAAPAAFGFLGPPASISVDSISLTVPEGQTLSLVGGDIQITGATLSAPSGRVQIASVASAGEVTIPDLDVGSFTSLGQINISANGDGVPSLLSASDVSGVGGGAVVIRGGRLIVAQSAIVADNFADVEGALVAVDLQVAEDVTLTNGASISTTANAAGRGGDIDINVGGKLEMQESSVVQTTTFGDGAAGNISANSGTLVLTGLSKIRSDTFGPGAGGNITVMVDDSAVISGHDGFGDASGLFSFTAGGNGGAVSLSAASLTMDDGGFIGSRSFGESPGGEVIVNVGSLSLTGGANILTNTSLAAGGNITVNADSAVISGVSSDIMVLCQTGICTTSSSDVGAAGNIALNVTGPITLTGGALIQSGTQFDPQGGNITVTGNSVTISDGSGISSQALLQDVGSVAISANTLIVDNGFVSTSTLEAGRAGDLTLNVGTLTLTRGGQVATSSLNAPGDGGNLIVNATNTVSISGASPSGSSVLPSPFGELINDARSGLFSTASGTGAGGQVNVSAPNVQITNDGVISTRSTGTSAELGAAPGNAGNVNMVVGTLRMLNGTVTTAAAEAAGGDITITHTGSLLHLTNSQITTSVNGGDGSGGNITIGAELDPVSLQPQNVNPFDFIVLNNGGIHANAFGGPGGNINIFSNLFLSSLPISTAVTASSALSTPGVIDIQATIVDVSEDISQLPQVPLQATELLRASCAARVAGGKSSSLVLGGRGGLPLEPGGLLPSPLYASQASTISSGGDLLAGGQVALLDGQFSAFRLNDERPQSRLGWNQFQLAKAALGLGCSQ